MADLLRFPAANQPPDAEARRQALEVDRSFIVEAPAGSGKTALLIQRFLRLLAEEAVTEPEQVLAITFTEKATGELRDRVLKVLHAAHQSDFEPPANELDRRNRELARSVLEHSRQLNWSLLEQPQRLNVRTIDSVCAKIARTLPVLSGSGGRLEPTTDEKPLHREAARKTLLLFGGGDPEFDRALNDVLLHRNGDLDDCEKLIARMLAVRDQWGHLVPLTAAELTEENLDSVVLPQLEAVLDQAICATLTRLEQLFPPDILDDLTSLAAELGTLDGYKGSANPVAICASLRKAPQAVSAHLDHWRALARLLVANSSSSWRKSLARNHAGVDWEDRHKKSLQKLIGQLAGHDDLLATLCELSKLPPPQYPPDQWAIAKSLFRVLTRALVELQLVFASHNQCDFTEIGLLAREALRSEGGADDFASALGASLQHLLVDEMQDTSTSQYELIELLTASWDGCSQTVFLVGDPRQSIYLFRQARVERFIRALRTCRLGDLRLTHLRLTANFRSQANLVGHFNRDFRLIFPEDPATAGNSLALPYQDAEPTQPASSSARGTVWHAHALAEGDDEEPSNPPVQLQRELDADEIIRIAREWMARPLPPGRHEPWKLAVLVRSRNHLESLITALRNAANPIPFRATEIESLEQRQEILDLTAITRALLHPADRVAWLAMLRAPWCGLSLADLYTLTGEGDPNLKHHTVGRLMDERGHLLPDDACQRIGRVWIALEAASAKRARFTMSQLVERVWRTLGGDAWLSAAQLTNAESFFKLLDDVEASGARIDPVLLEQRLEKLYAEPNTIPDGTPYLELLTIHKAKGLEWDVVFVPSLERGPRADSSPLLAWSEIDSDNSDEEPAAGMIAPIAPRGEPSAALNNWLRSIAERREAEERKRLFYVACTRARQELHLYASLELKTAKKTGSSSLSSPGAKSLLKAAWAAAEPQFSLAPSPSDTADKASSIDLAAAAEPASPPQRIIQRLPEGFDPAAEIVQARARRISWGEANDSQPHAAAFTRPEGSFAARSFGTVVHECLHLLADRLRNNSTPSSLISELPSWTPRIAAMLRADGHSAQTVASFTEQACALLENTLRDPVGAWLLANHADSGSEYSITSAHAANAEKSSATYRMDRVFRAGPEPLAQGDDYLWIVDYKTTPHGSSGIDAFVAAQRKSYAPQLDTYAGILAPASNHPIEKVRLALFFPAIPRLEWWAAGTAPQSR